MQFQVQAATIADVPPIIAAFDEAFANDHIVSQLFPDVPKEISWERDVKWYSAIFENADSNGERIFKAVDTSNG